MNIAALDVGSNSIHLVVVETDREKPFRVLASAKEVVRLGRSATRDRQLSPAAMDRAIKCLRRFSQTAHEHGAEEMIAVATSAVREAANRDLFLARAAAEAGVHIEMLSGSEEARLIALAVSVKYKQSRRQRALVIDIGGGSTELAVLKNGEPAVLISFKLGAVRLTEQFVRGDPISEKELRHLRSELRGLIAHRAQEIQAVGFDAVYGTSGTINTLSALSARRRLKAKNGRDSLLSLLRRSTDLSLTLDELRGLNQELATLSLEDRVRRAGINRQRAEIIVAGGQLLEALMEILNVTELISCDWALREGVIIAHLMRRIETVTTSPAHLERDPSLRGALALARRYQTDLNHAARVAYLAQQLFDQLRPLHLLGGEHRRLLAAAALLHDIGYFVAHTAHHKHSAYLIQHSELTGFTASEIAVIANVARYHRSSVPKLKHPYYARINDRDRELVRTLAALLRLADTLDRDHEGSVLNLRCEIGETTVRLIANSSRDVETVRRRLEERADLFMQVFNHTLEFMPSTRSPG